jgi:hypothetical protein
MTFQPKVFLKRVEKLRTRISSWSLSVSSPVYFIRHNVANDQPHAKPEALIKIASEDRIAIFWDLSSVDTLYQAQHPYLVNTPYFKEKHHKYYDSYQSAAGYFAELANSGGLVIAEYHSGWFHPDKFYGAKIGIVEPNSKIEPLNIHVEGELVTYGTTIKLTGVKHVRYSDCPVLLAVRPPYGTMCRPKSYLFTDIIPSLYDGKEPTLEIESLHPKMLEQLCVEFLRSRGLTSLNGSHFTLAYCTLKPGKSLATVDIVGISSDKRKLFAQVKFSMISPKDRDTFMSLAASNQDGVNIIFSDDASETKDNVIYKNVREIFDFYAATEDGRSMLRSMIGNFELYEDIIENISAA